MIFGPPIVSTEYCLSLFGDKALTSFIWGICSLRDKILVNVLLLDKAQLFAGLFGAFTWVDLVDNIVAEQFFWLFILKYKIWPLFQPFWVRLIGYPCDYSIALVFENFNHLLPFQNRFTTCNLPLDLFVKEHMHQQYTTQSPKNIFKNFLFELLCARSKNAHNKHKLYYKLNHEI